MTGLSAAGEAATLTPLTTTAYVSLHNGDPGNTGANEVAGGGYSRQGPIAFANFGSNPTIAANQAILTFPAATLSWGTIGYFGLWDALSGGAYRGSGALSQAKPIGAGDTARFLVNSLTVTVD